MTTDNYGILSPEEVRAKRKEREDGVDQWAVHSARTIAKLCTLAMARGANDVSIRNIYYDSGLREHLLVTKETVARAAHILMEAGYVIAWVNSQEREDTMRGAPGSKYNVTLYLMPVWDKLVVRLPKNENPLAGAST
jgi:hypothetical protein